MARTIIDQIIPEPVEFVWLWIGNDSGLIGVLGFKDGEGVGDLKTEGEVIGCTVRTAAGVACAWA